MRMHSSDDWREFIIVYDCPGHYGFIKHVFFIIALAEIISIKDVGLMRYYYVHYIDCKFVCL